MWEAEPRNQETVLLWPPLPLPGAVLGLPQFALDDHRQLRAQCSSSSRPCEAEDLVRGEAKDPGDLVEARKISPNVPEDLDP